MARGARGAPRPVGKGSGLKVRFMGLLSFLRKRRQNREIISRIYGTVMAMSRRTKLYSDLGIPDTFEGRFDSLTLHASLIAYRLNQLPEPGPEIARNVVDHLFAEFDSTLREMGVGDLAVPKRMKTMAAAFLGRAGAYVDAVQSGDRAVLEAVLRRNIFGSTGDAAQHQALVDYVLEMVGLLETLAVADFTSPELQHRLQVTEHGDPSL